jgi:hypothetical protein
VLGETGAKSERHLLEAVLEELVDDRDRQHEAGVAEHVVPKGGGVARDDGALDLGAVANHPHVAQRAHHERHADERRVRELARVARAAREFSQPHKSLHEFAIHCRFLLIRRALIRGVVVVEAGRHETDVAASDALSPIRVRVSLRPPLRCRSLLRSVQSLCG